MYRHTIMCCDTCVASASLHRFQVSLFIFKIRKLATFSSVNCISIYIREINVCLFYESLSHFDQNEINMCLFGETILHFD